ncbi:MAG: Uma2 family endonuclease [Euzebyales bacterium]|jgi:Uma2 family endonuclease|nr:Uma2 family endonuclease [Euzebyales bacterium]
MSAPTHTSGLVYADLERFGEDNVRRELIGGELIVSPSPRPRHQEVADELTWHLRSYCKRRGGRANSAPLDVVFTDADVLQPDVLVLTAEHLDRIGPTHITAAPDIVVEVSSPSTRHHDLVRKRAVFERYGVPEYWFVDLEADGIAVYRHDGDRYGQPTLLGRTDSLTTPLLPGFTAGVDELLGQPER